LIENRVEAVSHRSAATERSTLMTGHCSWSHPQFAEFAESAGGLIYVFKRHEIMIDRYRFHFSGIAGVAAPGAFRLRIALHFRSHRSSSRLHPHPHLCCGISPCVLPRPLFPAPFHSTYPLKGK
jgi:hypothetical protein